MDSIKQPFRFLALVLTLAFILLPKESIQAQSEHAGRGASEAIHSVYRITCLATGGSGTAFGHRSGRIITAAHVVSGCPMNRLQVVSQSGAITPISAVKSDPDLDLSILTPAIADFVKKPLGISSNERFTVGSQVSTWGFPGGYIGAMPLLSVGYLAGSQEIALTPNTPVRQWIVNGAFNRGNSGGPVLETLTGTVIGVISSKLTPMPRGMAEHLDELEQTGSAKDKKNAQSIRYLQSQMQLSISFAVLVEDLRSFLRRNSIEP